MLCGNDRLRAEEVNKVKRQGIEGMTGTERLLVSKYLVNSLTLI